MNTLERQKQIIERMKIRKFDTARNLAHEFGVSDKTIFRDIQELARSGHPIQAETGRFGGITWFGCGRKCPLTTRQMVALNNAIVLVSPEDKLVLQDLLRDNLSPKVKITKDDIFDLLRDGMSQTALARELGISGTLLSLVLSGRRNPSAELLERISKYRKKFLGNDEDNLM